MGEGSLLLFSNLTMSTKFCFVLCGFASYALQCQISRQKDTIYVQVGI